MKYIFLSLLLVNIYLCFDESKLWFEDTDKSKCTHFKDLGEQFRIDQDKLVLVGCKIRMPDANQFMAIVRIRGTELKCKSVAQNTMGRNENIIIHTYAKDEDCHKIIVKGDITLEPEL